MDSAAIHPFKLEDALLLKTCCSACIHTASKSWLCISGLTEVIPVYDIYISMHRTAVTNLGHV